MKCYLDLQLLERCFYYIGSNEYFFFEWIRKITIESKGIWIYICFILSVEHMAPGFHDLKFRERCYNQHFCSCCILTQNAFLLLVSFSRSSPSFFLKLSFTLLAYTDLSSELSDIYCMPYSCWLLIVHVLTYYFNSSYFVSWPLNYV